MSQDGEKLPFLYLCDGGFMSVTEEKILIFTSREICYNSHAFFASKMGEAFEQLGYEVEYCEFTKEDDFDAVLGPHLGKSYKLMMDFNSLMPQLSEEDGTPVLDLIEGPFYDYILDHPLFHYNCLSAKAKNFHAILLDEAQEAYVKRYYKGVKSSFAMPLGASEAVSMEKRSKNPDSVLFMGSYDSEEKLYGIIEMAPEPLKSLMKEVLERRIAEPTLPMEHAFTEVLARRSMELEDGKFSLFMNQMYAVDAFVRNYFRREAIEALAKGNVPVTIIGEGWHRCRKLDERYISFGKEVEFGLSFEKIAKEHILLNNSPFFNRGAHDRIFAGMANHCVVLTDENPYLRRNLKDGENIMLYSLKDTKSIKDRAEELLTNPVRCKEIQEAAYKEFLENHTWECRAKQLLQNLL